MINEPLVSARRDSSPLPTPELSSSLRFFLPAPSRERAIALLVHPAHYSRFLAAYEEDTASFSFKMSGLRAWCVPVRA